MKDIKLLIDTDMGGDIDDAFALTMALNSPEIALQAVTTVYYANRWRADNVRRMLSVFGRGEIPVGRGAECPLAGSWHADAPRGRCLPNEAAALIVETCRSEPETVLLAIGPMTNVALAFSLAPDVAQGRRVFAMGGMLREARSEWNVMCDPEAARVVLQSGARVTMVGLDVTEQCKLGHGEIRALMAPDTPQMAFLRGELARFYQMFSFVPTLHDPLTLAALLWPELLSFENRAVRVDASEGPERGMLSRVEGSAPNVRWATAVDAKAAVERMCARFAGKE